MQDNVKSGTVEGTGVAINVPCGFQPRVVKIMNVDGIATLDWEENMGAACGFKAADSGAGAVDFSLITSGGITKYAGTKPPTLLTGTCAVAVGSAVVTGTSTLFLAEAAAGDILKIGGIFRTVLSIASATSLTMTEAYTAVQTAGIGYNLAGKSEGFTIGTDGDVNVSAETINWIAWK